MADGDLAASKSIPLVPSTADVRQGFAHHNATRDIIVQQTQDKAVKADVDQALGQRVRVVPGSAHAGIGFYTTSDGKLWFRPTPESAAYDVRVLGTYDLGAGDFLPLSGGTLTGPLSLASAAPVTNSYVALYRNGDGRVGVSPSAARFKKNIRDKEYTLDQLLRIRVVSYQLRAALFADDYPQRANAPTDIGVIAEELIDAGLSEFVVFDDEGQALSVHYERLALVAIGALQDLAHQLDTLAERITNLENAHGDAS